MPTRRRRPLTARGTGALVLGLLLVIAANIAAAPILLYVAMLLFVIPMLSAIVVHAPRRSGTVARQVSTDLLTVGERSGVTVRFALRSRSWSLPMSRERPMPWSSNLCSWMRIIV